ncbi:MAG: hypothetical protein QOG87_1065 [Actinomycetota bacterium]|jgi:hypothetical protein
MRSQTLTFRVVALTTIALVLAVLIFAAIQN